VNKLIIQIPCFNEAQSLPRTLADLPRQVPGFDRVEWLVIDDGSTDGTAEVARAGGADHVVRFDRNRGLAKAFMAGLDRCLALGADVIVNTDGDNQYCAADIPRLVEPLLAGRASVVIGARPVGGRRHSPPIKRWLHRLGSWVVRRLSQTDVPDAPSGFRAISRDAAMQMNVFDNYTYTLETIIQAGQKHLGVAWVPVRVNEPLRPSRLIRSVPDYVRRSLVAIVRSLVVYKSFRFFFGLGLALFLAGAAAGLWAWLRWRAAPSAPPLGALLAAGLLLLVGVQAMLAAFLADLLSVNRRLLEELQYRLRRRDHAS